MELVTNKFNFGLHYIVDAHGCGPELIRDEEHIREFLKVLVKDIDMVAFGPAFVQRFGEDNLLGYTAVQLIETSNIAIHFYEPTNSMYFDLFSCKDFDKEVVKDLINNWFYPTSISKELLLYR